MFLDNVSVVFEFNFTFLESCKHCDLFDESGFNERRFDADGRNDRSNDEEIVAQLAVVVTVSLRELLYERITQLTVNTHKTPVTPCFQTFETNC